MTSNKPASGQRPRRVTAADVAKVAGVSRSAVSRAFTQGAYIDAEKRALILKR
ncbi:MAG: LacI family DNA-binding transcriptional regulator [Maritimibacter sp.]